MSLSVSGYSQSYPHHPHHHQPHHYHHPHHPLQNGNVSNAGPGGGIPSPGATHDFYAAYPHPQMPRFPEHPDSVTSAAATAVAVSGGYFPNWMLSPPELSSVSGHIPDGYHSFGAPGANSPGGSHYQSFIQYENGVPVRCIKRRVTANKKERRRTLSINNAFAQLRGCIPNVPSDTKLSKIKTLRLATSYISYLMDILAKDDPELSRTGFKAELTKKVTCGQSGSSTGVCSISSVAAVTTVPSGKIDATITNAISQARTILERTEEKRKRESDGESETSSQGSSPCPEKKPKGRTGWPQHVWAAELK